MSEEKKWVLKLPMVGADVSIVITGDVTYDAIIRAAKLMLEVGDDLRPTGQAKRTVQVDLGQLWPGSLKVSSRRLGASTLVPYNAAEVEPIAPFKTAAEALIMNGADPNGKVTAEEAEKVQDARDIVRGRPRADCPACGANVTVTEEGSLRVHGPIQARCPGVAPEPPAEAAPAAVPVFRGGGGGSTTLIIADEGALGGSKAHNPDWLDEPEPSPAELLAPTTSVDEQARTLF
jgi:hypothetical protein